MNKDAIFEYLKLKLERSNTAFTEHTLLRSLQDEGLLSAVSENPELALFQRHFITMNALYRLQIDFFENQQRYLKVSALHIELMANTTAIDTALSEESSDSKLRAYYLDWSELESASAESVGDLISDFWKRYSEHLVLDDDSYGEALKVLELQGPLTLPILKSQYRKLANHYHPDKGGDQKKFVEISEAYQVLSVQFSRAT